MGQASATSVATFFNPFSKRFIERDSHHHIKSPANKGKSEILLVLFGDPDTNPAFDAFGRFIDHLFVLVLFGAQSAVHPI